MSDNQFTDINWINNILVSISNWSSSNPDKAEFVFFTMPLYLLTVYVLVQGLRHGNAKAFIYFLIFFYFVIPWEGDTYTSIIWQITVGGALSTWIFTRYAILVLAAMGVGGYFGYKSGKKM